MKTKNNKFMYKIEVPPQLMAQDLISKFALGAWGKEHAKTHVENIIAEIKELEKYANIKFNIEVILYWKKVLAAIEMN